MLVVSVKQYIIKCFIGILAQITALRPEKGVPEFGTLSLSLFKAQQKSGIKSILFVYICCRKVLDLF
jgi:hypothetical protein